MDFPLEVSHSVVDWKCKEKCPYHCKSWMVKVGGGKFPKGFLEDKTLTFQMGKKDKINKFNILLIKIFRSGNDSDYL